MRYQMIDQRGPIMANVVRQPRGPDGRFGPGARSVETLKDLDLSYPQLEPARRRELAALRRQLAK